MLKNYLLIAFRNLWRNKSYTSINLFGLSIGIAATLLILIYILFEFSYDQFHKNIDSIYRISVVHQKEGKAEYESHIYTPPIGPAMKKDFHGKFALQIMFIDENKTYAYELAELSREIKPNEVQINTPTRSCDVIPLQKDELKKIEKMFHGLNTISVYTSRKPLTNPLDKAELIKRRRMEL